ncbi:MAG: TldD/PmbA family protein [Candidatus Verstraetearchaeota archaeon]|nr:TldD/PmbA family protein [Candidatus Verstraetearchaeota archaeon]
MKDELFSIGDEVLKALLQRGADGGIVIPVHKDRTMIRFANNRIIVVQSWSIIGVEFLCTFNRRRVIGRIENLCGEAVKSGVERALAEAKLVPEDREFVPVPEGNKYPARKTAEVIDPERMSEGARDAIDSALRGGAERVSGAFTGDITRRCILSSTGTEGYEERPSFELNVRAFRGEASGQGLSCATSMNSIDAKGAGEEAGWIAKEGANLTGWSEGRYQVLFGPIIAANLVEHLGEAASAFLVDAGLSCMAGKIGEMIFSEGLTVIDDGSSEDGLCSRTFDDEGTKTKRNTIIENGVVKGYLHNVKTAAKFKTESTGNAGWITPLPWNLIVEGGNIGFKEALEDIKTGLYIVSNWYTRFQNYSTGDFSTICRDGIFLIENGVIKGSLKGVRISDNLVRIFSSISAICKERKWVKWWEVRTPIYLPAMVVSDVRITKAQGA